MKIKKLHIKNFKSLVDLEIVEPNPFTVFVGANGVGKSNIFEALEFVNISSTTFFDSVIRFFGGEEDIANDLNKIFYFESYFDEFNSSFISDYKNGKALYNYYKEKGYDVDNDALPINHSNFLRGESPHRLSVDENGEMAYPNKSYRQFFGKFSHIFIGASKKQITPYNDDKSLNLSASNLEKVLKRILLNENNREEILEWLQLFIPGFDTLKIESNSTDGIESLSIYEIGSSKKFHRNLISDGTYNLLCLLTAVYQSDEPQFLCIEEPENGLTPDVLKEMVTLFRNACEERGHYIWLNTHSQSLVSQLTPDEIIIVDKIKGETKIKQFKGKDFFGLRMDDAWLTNSLGGGLPW